MTITLCRSEPIWFCLTHLRGHARLFRVELNESRTGITIRAATVDDSVTWETAEMYLRRWIHREQPSTPDWQIAEILRWRKDLFDMTRSEKDRVEYIKSYKRRALETYEERFSRWLSETLEAHELTQSDLARRIGSPPSVVSKWVNGQQRPRPEQCQKIGAALNESHLEVMEEAGHLPHDFTFEGDGFRKNVRDEILDMVFRIPEPLLVPFAPMFRRLAEPAIANEALEELETSLSSLAQFANNQRSVEGEEEKSLSSNEE
jgi:transcriptional regulator with XRE-family HTH domain